MTKTLTEITSELIKFKTVKTELYEIKSCLEWITKEFGEGASVTQFPHDTAPSLLLTANGVMNPKILLVGHIDVVFAQESQFIPKIEKGKLYGRGAFDMKGPLAATLLAFKSTIENSKDGSIPSVGILITSDEEIGGKDGVGRILKEYSLKPEIAIIPDGGNTFDVAEGGKGVGWLDITFKAKAAHVSRPWEGKNAIQLMAKALVALEKKYPGMQEIETEETTLSPILVTTANTSSNIVPDHSFVSLNLRFTRGFDLENLRKTVEALEGVSDVVIKRSIEPYQANLSHSLSQKFLKILEEKTGTPLVTKIYPSTCDARFFARLDIPVIVTRPKGGDAHGPNEWIDLDSLLIFQEIIEAYIK